jgi:hypothetical protein
VAEAGAPGRRRRRRRKGRRQGRPHQAIALALATALTLLTLAVPRTLALVTMIPAEYTLEGLRQQRPVEREALGAAIEAGLAASAWHESGALWQQIAAAHLGRLSFVSGDRQAQQDALLQAEGALQRALARRPGDAMAWWRLAWVASMLQRSPEQVAAPLHLSVLTGSRLAVLVFPRLRLALAHWQRLDDRARAAFKPQLAWAMTADPQGFIILVRRSLAEEAVRTAFRDDADLLTEYQTLIERSRPWLGARQG